MGKEHKKHKKHKHSKNKHKPKDEGYHVPIVPLKNEMRSRPVTPGSGDAKTDVKTIGPILPPNLSNLNVDQTTTRVSVSGGETNDSYGPSLPPHLVQQKRAPGPSLPLDFKIEEKTESVDDDISGIGPLPAELITSDSEHQFIQKQLELRAEYMKRKFAGEVCAHRMEIILIIATIIYLCIRLDMY